MAQRLRETKLAPAQERVLDLRVTVLVKLLHSPPRPTPTPLPVLYTIKKLRLKTQN